MSFKALQSEVNKSMFTHAQKLKETVSSLSKKCENPPIKAKWPWNQKCAEFPGKCNYQYLLITTQTDQESIVAGCANEECKMLIAEEFHADDMSRFCKKYDTKDFYGGILGWTSGDKLPEPQTCDAATDKANKFNNDMSMLAIPRYVRLASGSTRALFCISAFHLLAGCTSLPTQPPTHAHTQSSTATP